MYNAIKNIKESELGGVLYHTYQWILSPTGDLVYSNPKYKPSSSGDSVKDNIISIYCVHGTADRVSSFKDLSQNILQGLPENVSGIKIVSFYQRAFGQCIEYFSNTLANTIKENNDKNVILIGHSRGGLIVSYYAEYLAKHFKVNVPAVFTIGAPFSGSKSAQFPLSLYSQSIKEMQVDSGFLRLLKKKTATSNIKYVSYAAKVDGLVAVDSSYPEAASSVLNVHDNVNHLSILHTDELSRSIAQEINSVADTFSHTEKISDCDNFSIGILDVCDDIDMEIERMKIRLHIKSSVSKQQVLLSLKTKLMESLSSGISCYPDAKTVSQFITEFLLDNRLFSGKMPMQIMAEPLNYSFSLINKPQHKTDSQLFLDLLIERYRNLELNDNTLRIKYKR